MNLHNASFVLSAVAVSQYPTLPIPEIAFAGRSNVGKSSFINKVLNRKKLARTSATPGKTAQINFYNIDQTIHLVDLPGYGYAAVSKQEKKRWGEMIDVYLNTRMQLIQTILLVDARHKPTLDDITMAGWIRHRHGRLMAFATKADKISKNQLEENLLIIKKALKWTDGDILLPFSAETGQGKEDALALICELCGVEEIKQ